METEVLVVGLDTACTTSLIFIIPRMGMNKNQNIQSGYILYGKIQSCFFFLNKRIIGITLCLL